MKSNGVGKLRNVVITRDNIGRYADRLNNGYPVDVAELIEAKPIEEALLIFGALDPEFAVVTFSYLVFRIQKELLAHLPSQRVAQVLTALPPDDRTKLLEELPGPLVNQLLKYLSPAERALSLKLLNYPEDSVGRLMTPDYIAVKMDWTVRQVLDYIRIYGRDSETINVIYAVDDVGHLIDDFRIRQFLIASPDTRVEELADHKFLQLHVDDDEEVAIGIFRKYERSAIPVVDGEGILLGIVTLDDILAVAVQEDTEDIQKIGGVEALDEPYMLTPLLSLFRKRAGWLVVLFLGELLTASAMAFFEEEIAKAVVLALFVPLILSSGGNAGSQAASLIIRALALGEVTLADWWRIMRREIASGLLLGAVLGSIGFFRVSLWSAFSSLYGPHWLMVGVTLFISLIGVVLWGTVTGSMLPLILRRAGFDPALSSAPFLATLVDVTGLIIYFSVAMVVLQGSLL